MFERFTDGARQVLVLAMEEATRLKHDYIGTEHILLGLLREEEGLAGRVLQSLDITVDEVRAQVVAIVGEGDGEPATGQIPFTPRGKKVLELSLSEALALGDNYIGTEHVLLGLVRENEGVAARILLDFGVDAEAIRKTVMGALPGSGTGTPSATSERERRPHRPVELTSPPLASELIEELERLVAERDGLLRAHELERAATIRHIEQMLRGPAEDLVNAWRRHTGRAGDAD